MDNKIYIGNGKEYTFSNGGTCLRVSFSPEDLIKINDWARGNNGWCNIDVLKRKEPSKKGVTHYGIINQWKPEKKNEQSFNTNIAQSKEENEEMPLSDVPF